LAANGEITVILTLKQSATIQLVKPSFDLTDGIQTTTQIEELEQEVEGGGVPVHSMDLTPGSLLVLSGEGRWNWVHRVLPQQAVDGMERVSLVFGVSSKPMPPK